MVKIHSEKEQGREENFKFSKQKKKRRNWLILLPSFLSSSSQGGVHGVQATISVEIARSPRSRECSQQPAAVFIFKSPYTSIHAKILSLSDPPSRQGLFNYTRLKYHSRVFYSVARQRVGTKGGKGIGVHFARARYRGETFSLPPV